MHGNLVHIHLSRTCRSCGKRGACRALCDEIEAWVGQDKPRTTDSLERSTVEYDDEVHSHASILQVEVSPVVEALRRLPVMEVAVVSMRYYGGLKTKQIGQMIGVTRQRIESVLKRSERRLRGML